MATISVGESKHGKRAVDHDLPLVPFIDFMVCLIAFLMVTAVWTQMSRINATGKVPGLELGPTPAPRKELHVFASSRGFELRWQQGATVLETRQLPRPAPQANSDLRFPELSAALNREWEAHGVHRAPNDRALDQAVLHVQNDLPFAEIVAVLDALHAPRRAGRSAFEVAFAAN
jgi:hypothetical protein